MGSHLLVLVRGVTHHGLGERVHPFEALVARDPRGRVLQEGADVASCQGARVRAGCGAHGVPAVEVGERRGPLSERAGSGEFTWRTGRYPFAVSSARSRTRRSWRALYRAPRLVPRRSARTSI